jgi:hypothetical protein
MSSPIRVGCGFPTDMLVLFLKVTLLDGEEFCRKQASYCGTVESTYLPGNALKFFDNTLFKAEKQQL